MPDVKKIALVDDHTMFRKGLAVLIGLFSGYKVLMDVANGREFIDQLDPNELPDIVLLDIHMPVMDGYTATAEIRNKLKSDIPVIAMTAHAFSGEREKCISYGMDDYISKPIREDVLLTLIKQYASTKSSANGRITSSTMSSEKTYKYISLQYMKEISRGNVDYETTITEQFIEAMPNELNMLEQSWHNYEIDRLRQSAHNMKTTISVMGLNKLLENYLDFLEYNDLDENTFYVNYSPLQFICNEALEEAKRFYKTLHVLTPL